MTRKEAIKTILSDKKSFLTTLNYAVDYCNSALNMSGHELDVQCLYILNNIVYWRHPQAKDVRKALRKEKGNEDKSGRARGNERKIAARF